MKKSLFVGMAGLLALTSVCAFSSSSKGVKRIPVKGISGYQSLTDTVPDKPGKHKKSDTTGYPKKDTMNIK